jgi:hypothetical protein
MKIWNLVWENPWRTSLKIAFINSIYFGIDRWGANESKKSNNLHDILISKLKPSEGSNCLKFLRIWPNRP